MILRAKTDIKLIDDGYLVTVSVSGTDEEGKSSGHGNMGKVFKDLDKAVAYGQKEMAKGIDEMHDKTGTLPGMDGEEEPE